VTKKLLGLSLVVLFGFATGICFAKYSGGDGSESTPYRISDANDMNEIGAYSNDWDKHFVLTDDVDMSGFEYTTALIAPDTNNSTAGFQGTAFTGVFNGSGYVIRNLTIDDVGARNNYLGLFGKIDNASAQITNLGFVDTTVSGNSYVASLVGDNGEGTISNCYATGNVTVSGDKVGGLAGNNSGPISNCYARVFVSGNDKVGGLTGQNYGTITNCYSAAEIVVTSGLAEPYGIALDTAAGKMYWTDYYMDKIQRANLDGSDVEELVISGLSEPRGIALDTAASKMYWTDEGTDKIKRANLDGTSVEALITSGLSRPRGIALDIASGKMYWTDYDDIRRANLDGTGIEDLVTVTISSSGIALDTAAGKMYWIANERTSKIQRADLDGTNVEDVVVSLTLSSGIALDVAGSKIYWTDTWSDKIQRANFDGTNVEDLVTSGLSNPPGIALDVAAGKMYWTDSGKIQRANLDGSNIALALVINGGGLVGYDSSGTYTKSFWDSDVNPDVNGIGNAIDANVIGESTANMKTQSTFTGNGWDLVSTWLMPTDGIDYPHLAWEEPSYPGNGTAGEPYQISVTKQLNEIGTWPFHWDKHFILTVDIDLSGFEYKKALIAPDTDSTNGLVFDGVAFTGVFDGGGHVIKNLTIDDAEAGNDFLGLFGKIDGTSTQINNLGLVDVNISGDAYIALLSGCNNHGIISNCYAIGNISGSSDNIGGLVGDNYGPISNCYTRGSVAGKNGLGGLIGQNSAAITNCYSATEILKKIYWTDSPMEGIKRANLNGNAPENLIKLGYPQRIALDPAASKMYWTDGAYNKIHRANLDGTNVEDIVTSGLDEPDGIVVDVAASKMYWTDSVTRKIQRANLDGSNIESLVTLITGWPRGIALDSAASKMYWTNSGTGKIQRANLDGTGVEDLVASGLDTPYGIALDIAAGKMYWTDLDANKIQRSNFDGTVVEDLITSGLSWPYDIALDPAAGKMYWTDVDTDKIKRANLDGSCVEDVIISGLSQPKGIALARTNGGGLIGSDAGGSYTACFWDSTVNSQFMGIGNISDPCDVVEESTSNMQTQSTYTSAGWDFVGETVNGPNDIWTIHNGNDYPIHVWPLINFVGWYEVDLADYAFFSNFWKNTNCGDANDCSGVDLDFSDAVDGKDLKILFDKWLTGLQ